jgi:hypothetical protein
MELAEDHLEMTCAALQVDLRESIHFYKHPSQADLRQQTGSRSTGVVLAIEDGQPLELHSVHGYDPHEVMHALAHQSLGEPPAFFDEGLATAFGWDWTPGETEVHERAVGLLREGRLVALERLLTNWDFRSYQSYPAYTTAGSFVKYVLAVYGPGGLPSLFQLDKYSSREAIEARFAEAYGRDIYRVEAGWLAALGGGALASESAPPSSQVSPQQIAGTGLILLVATFLLAVLAILAGEEAVGVAVRRLRALR